MRRSAKWGLLAQTVTLFLVLTIHISVDQYAALLELIENRNFPGTETLPPGPIGYDATHSSLTPFAIYIVMFPLNQWLSDGLLVSSVKLQPFAHLTHAIHTSSCIVAMSSIL